MMPKNENAGKIQTNPAPAFVKISRRTQATKLTRKTQRVAKLEALMLILVE
jgi:hypothetical protein